MREIRTSGAEGRAGKRARRDPGTAPRPGPYPDAVHPYGTGPLYGLA